MPTNPIVPKRNSSAGSATGPQASALQLGEIASNTFTGKLYLKKEDNTVAEIGGAGSTATPVLTQFTGNGSTTTWPVSGYTTNNVRDYLVVVGGVPQAPSGSTYTISAGTIVFSQAPANGVTGFVLAYQGTISPETNFASETKTATAGQTVFTLTSATYTPNSGSILVYRNGLLLTPGTDYAQTNSSTITLTSGATVGDELVIFCGRVANDSTVYQLAASGSVARGVAAKLGETVSVKDFGAAGDGTTNDTTAIQAAITAVSSTGGVVYFPAGTYAITGTLNVQGSGVALVGANANATKLVFNNGSSDSIYLQGLSAPGTYDCQVRDMTLDHSSKTGGSAIRLYRANRVRIARVIILNGWNGIDCKTINDVVVEKVVATGMRGAFGCRFWSLATGAERADVLTLRDSAFDMGSYGGDGIVWDGFAHTLRCFGVGIINAARGLLIQNTEAHASYCPAFGMFVDLEIDGTTGQACRIEGGSTFTFTGCDLFNLATATGAIMEVLADASASLTNSVRISNCRIGGGQRQALIFGGRDLVLSNSHVGGGNDTAYEAIQLPANAQDVVIVGCAIGSWWGYPQKHTYGVTIANPVYRVLIDDCSFYGCQTGEVQNSSTTGTIQLGQCINRTGKPEQIANQTVIRKDINNGVADERIYNAGTGASTIARRSWQTVTTNSASFQDLQDNSGSPYWRQSHAAAVGTEYFDCDVHRFRTAAGVAQFAIGAALPNYASDTAAAAGGVPLYGYYRNGNAVQQRIA